jgi:hypothetical protein
MLVGRQVLAPQYTMLRHVSSTVRPSRGNRVLFPMLALSTSEAELIRVAVCAQGLNFCHRLATELVFIQPGPTPIAEDNTVAIVLIALLEHGHFKGRSKHVHLRWCFVCDYIDTGVIHLSQTPSRDQLADIGTKACPAQCSSAQAPAFSPSRWSVKEHRRLAKGIVFLMVLPLGLSGALARQSPSGTFYPACLLVCFVFCHHI